MHHILGCCCCDIFLVHIPKLCLGMSVMFSHRANCAKHFWPNQVTVVCQTCITAGYRSLLGDKEVFHGPSLPAEINSSCMIY